MIDKRFVNQHIDTLGMEIVELQKVRQKLLKDDNCKYKVTNITARLNYLEGQLDAYTLIWSKI